MNNTETGIGTRRLISGMERGKGETASEQLVAMEEVGD